jgi:hypothetical protein
MTNLLKLRKIIQFLKPIYALLRGFLELLDETERKFAIAFIKWLKNREIP